MPHIAIYARKSTESEDRQILSIDSQVKELRDYAESQNLRLAKVFTESMSAKSPGRPVFNEVMKLIQKGNISEILCWKLDRLARNPVDGGALIWAMEEKKLVNIHTPQRTFVNTGNDKFWMQLEFGMAKKYVDDLSDNVKRGLRAKVNMGWRPGNAPLGYLNDKANKTIIKDPERYPLVRKMWDLMLTGDYTPFSVLKIATERWGLRTRQFRRMGGKPMAYSAVYALFNNPFYYGAIYCDNEQFQGAHPPMISRSEFERVQRILHRPDKARPNTYFFPYTGMIKCGECGASVTAEHKTNRQGHKYIYYHCTKRKRSVKCTQKSIEAHKLDMQIANFLGTLTISSEFKDWAIQIIKGMRQEENEKDIASTASMKNRANSCKKELDELLNMKLRGLLNDEEYSGKKTKLLDEMAKIQELLADNDKRFTQILARCEEAFDFACRARELFLNGPPEARKAILSYSGSNLVLKDGLLRFKVQKPLLLIQKSLLPSTAPKGMFEPSKKRLECTQAAPFGDGFRAKFRLVKDVRTFYWENRSDLELLRLPDILKSKSFNAIS